jgi:uncharacterized protein
VPGSDPITTLRELAPALRREYGVTSLSIFGSAARGQALPQSDIDVLVAFAPDANVTLFTLASLSLQLEQALGRRVDLVEDHPRLTPRFRAAIQQDLLRVA